MFENIPWEVWLDVLVQGVIRFGGGLLILLLAWIVGRLIRRGVRGLLGRIGLDSRISQTVEGEPAFSIENVLSQLVFWVIMLFGLMSFFNYVNLDMVNEPLAELTNTIVTALPQLITALLLLGAAYLVATVVKQLIVRGGGVLGLDKRLEAIDSETATATSVTQSLGIAGYWLVFLLFLPSILSQLGMSTLVDPLNDMLNDLLSALPNLLKTALVLVVGVFVARIVRQIVSGLLNAANVDRFGRNAGLNISITNLVGTLIYTVIVLLTIVQALETLAIDTISRPATEMIELVFSSVPNVIGAGLLLAVSYIVARLVGDMVKNLLESAGFDNIPARLGLTLEMERSLSEWASWIIIVGTMLLAALPAAEMLGFTALTDIVAAFIAFGGQILVGIIVLTIGIFIANFARDVMLDAGQSSFAATFVRAAVLVLVTGMALQAIGIGEDIVQLAFGIGLGAIGIAAALAFGLGGRETAGRELEQFVQSMRQEE